MLATHDWLINRTTMSVKLNSFQLLKKFSKDIRDPESSSE